MPSEMQALPLSERMVGRHRTASGSRPGPSTARRVSVWELQAYRATDELSGVLIYVMVVFSPWALGSTQSWSIWTMNIGGYGLGLLLAFKVFLRLVRHCALARCTEHRSTTTKWLMPALAALTLLILAFCLVSALNARATFDDRTLAFQYHGCIAWLPHSLDSTASWFAFWMYLGLACFFWGLRDWLLGKSMTEERAGWQQAADWSLSRNGAAEPFPERLTGLLWVMTISGGVLAFEAIVQRGLNSPNLLFLVKPRVHQTADGQFGPYAYRSNAAQYFNLLWPVAVGFWWSLGRGGSRKGGQKQHPAVLAAAGVMAAGSVISTSRAGALIAMAMVVFAGASFAAADWARRRSRAGHHNQRRRGSSSRGLLLFLACTSALGLLFGWDTLKPRMSDFNEAFAGRERNYQEAGAMAGDYPWFGTGPGTFETVAPLYAHTEVLWAQLHNDWLETRITFGRVGSALIAAAFGCVVLPWLFGGGGIHASSRLTWLIYLALGGCLLHARFDFPFQIHSILVLFLTWCGVISVVTTPTPRPVHDRGVERGPFRGLQTSDAWT